jgi:S-adenosyl-L-methionine hydrolase (adenosine-forming)
MDAGPPLAVYFLSDYGNADEFAGVVRAVLFRLAPEVRVVDLSHEVPSFDVAAGADLLLRCVPHLGAGVVLAVVDPGVGTERRGVAVHVAAPPGDPGGTPSPAPAWLVGPDNGLLVPAAEALGGVDRVVELTPAAGQRSTFDGRDLFAPASAHLARGGDPGAIGTQVPATGLATLAVRGAAGGRAAPPEGTVVASVTWIDRFGNVQLDLGPVDLDRLGLAPGARADVELETPTGAAASGGHPYAARRVRSFAELAPGELGVLIDANGRVALVFDRASAAGALGFAGPGSYPSVRLRVAGDEPAG